MPRAAAALAALALLVAQNPVPAADPPAADRTARLAAAGRLWGVVKFRHPAVWTTDLDWDAALTRALPAVTAADTAERYADAVDAMLATLGDPATRVIRPPAPAGGRPGVRVESLGDGRVLIALTDPTAVRQLAADAATRAKVCEAIAGATGVVFDLRGPAFTANDPAFAGLADLLTDRPVTGPSVRTVVHSGYRPQTGTTSGGYSSAFETRPGTTFRPGVRPKTRPVVFLASANTGRPEIALALQAAGSGCVVAQGTLADNGAGLVEAVPLADGLRAAVRVGQRVDADGLVRPRADVEVPADADSGPDGPAVRAAVAFLKDPAGLKRPPRAKEPAAEFRWRPDPAHAADPYPDRGHRLLALFRLWSVIDHFFPYKHLTDEDWSVQLPRFLPRFEAAGDAREYALAVAELVTQFRDGHGFVRSEAIETYFGPAVPGVRLRVVEGVPAVVQVTDPDAAKAGLAAGDVVVAVDGEKAADRIARYGKHLSGSTPAGHARAVLSRVLGGAEGSECRLTVRGADGKERVVSVKRAAANRAVRPPDGEAFRVLDGNVGYVDLNRLKVADVGPMLDALKGTKGIVFDMRGYPNGTAWALAPRLNVKDAKDAAEFRRQVVGGRNHGTATFRQPIPPARPGEEKYAGKCVMLVDERTVSQAEHTGLFLEAACGVTFIGSQTAGANGDVTNVVLPGGVAAYFSGHDVRHADGRPLQRVGLVPHVEAKPTLAGLRAGRDEVLDRGVRVITGAGG